VIPRVIHHVWPGADPFRPELHRFRESFFRHHPDWTFRFWRTEADGFSPEVGALLEDPRYTVVVKSDVLRFELLRLYGGIYVDTDVECLRSFEPLLGDAFFCGRESESLACPSVLGAVPGHPLSALLVREALQRIAHAGVELANRAPNEVSGPCLLTELVAGRDDVRVHPPGHFYPIGWWETARLGESAPGAFAKHWWRGKTSADGWTKHKNFGVTRAGAPLMNGPIKYELGGTRPRAGYVTVNLTGNPDRWLDITELDRLHAADGEVDTFLIEHTLEHVPLPLYRRFLTDLKRKLKRGGTVVVVQTDAEAVIRDYAAGGLSFRSMRSTLFPPEDRVRDNPLMAHQSMWSASELARDFAALGFAVQTFDAGTWALDTQDEFHDGDLAPDRGKPIRNLGVRATKP
jgi:inositol phosphorylceramide mannosyltransferase catalytic subunit